MQRREFLQVLALAAAAGLPLAGRAADAGDGDAAGLYEGLAPFGDVALLHITDTHAQLNPMHYREPSVELNARGGVPHVVGQALLRRHRVAPGSAMAHALTYVDFVAAARRYGAMGGYAHLSTLLQRLRALHPQALLLDGGDAWQGSATALWTRAQDMVGAQRLLGVNALTAHWEFTYGADRLRAVQDADGRIDLLAQNVRLRDGDAVFPTHTQRVVNGVPVTVIGQAYPFTASMHPAHFVRDWTFGIGEDTLQREIDLVRGRGAQVIVLLSHNGTDIDVKLASRVRGLDAILGGHTHDATPAPLIVSNAGGKTLVTNAGSHGKFVGVLEFAMHGKRVGDFRYRLLPVFAQALPADRAMSAYIDRVRAPFAERLATPLAVNTGLLYRRGTTNGTLDQLVVDALRGELDAPIALTPGYRFGASLLAGDTITTEHVVNATAITYPATTVTSMTGAAIQQALETAADGVFNRDPYQRRGDDMPRTGGLQYALAPHAPYGQRVTQLRAAGVPLDAARVYTVAAFGAADTPADAPGEPVYDVVARYLRSRGTLPALQPDRPRLVGVAGDPGIGPPPAT